MMKKKNQLKTKLRPMKLLALSVILLIQNQSFLKRLLRYVVLVCLFHVHTKFTHWECERLSNISHITASSFTLINVWKLVMLNNAVVLCAVYKQGWIICTAAWVWHYYLWYNWTSRPDRRSYLGCLTYVSYLDLLITLLIIDYTIMWVYFFKIIGQKSDNMCEQ